MGINAGLCLSESTLNFNFKSSKSVHDTGNIETVMKMLNKSCHIESTVVLYYEGESIIIINNARMRGLLLSRKHFFAEDIRKFVKRLSKCIEKQED